MRRARGSFYETGIRKFLVSNKIDLLALFFIYVSTNFIFIYRDMIVNHVRSTSYLKDKMGDGELHSIKMAIEEQKRLFGELQKEVHRLEELTKKTQEENRRARVERVRGARQPSEDASDLGE